jgi:flagellar protein FlbD
MIRLTRMSRSTVILNSDLIEHIEETPDTVITLTSGQKLMVMESAEDIIAKVIEFRTVLASRLGCALIHSGANPAVGTLLTQVTDGR